MFEKAIFYINHAIRTVTFFYGKEFSSDWDKVLNSWVDDCKSFKVTDHTVDFNLRCGRKPKVWVSNEFFCYGYLYERDDYEKAIRAEQYRPKASTMWKLNQLVQKARKQQKLDGIERINKLNQTK